MAPIQSVYTDILRENSLYIGGVLIAGIVFVLYKVRVHTALRTVT